MKPYREYGSWAAIAIVSRVIDPLIVEAQMRDLP
jgi:hypothetical protein